MTTSPSTSDALKVGVTRLTQKRVEAMARLVALRVPFEYQCPIAGTRNTRELKWGIYVHGSGTTLSPHVLSELSKLGFRLANGVMSLEGRV